MHLGDGIRPAAGGGFVRLLKLPRPALLKLDDACAAARQGHARPKENCDTASQSISLTQ